MEPITLLLIILGGAFVLVLLDLFFGRWSRHDGHDAWHSHDDGHSHWASYSTGFADHIGCSCVWRIFSVKGDHYESHYQLSGVVNIIIDCPRCQLPAVHRRRSALRMDNVSSLAATVTWFHMAADGKRLLYRLALAGWVQPVCGRIDRLAVQLPCSTAKSDSTITPP